MQGQLRARNEAEKLTPSNSTGPTMFLSEAPFRQPVLSELRCTLRRHDAANMTIRNNATKVSKLRTISVVRVIATKARCELLTSHAYRRGLPQCIHPSETQEWSRTAGTDFKLPHDIGATSGRNQLNFGFGKYCRKVPRAATTQSPRVKFTAAVFLCG